VVAVILASSLGLIAVLILVVTAVQIVDHQTPDLVLSENATQIMIAAIGGLTGLLGAYLGAHLRKAPEATRDEDGTAGS
jgi:hypothetical protein